MEQSLLQLGLNITLFGMSIVFVFLLLLAICTGIMSRLVARYFAVNEPLPKVADQPLAVDDARILEVIQLAITQHRKNR